MTIWRLARTVYPALGGEGARRAGGRWNRPGTPAVHTSAHLSLAVLEALVHTDPDLLPDDLAAFKIDVPDDLVDAAAQDPLPEAWRDAEASAAFGEAWAASGSAVLVVPSVLVPRKRNVLVNPRPAASASSGRSRLRSIRASSGDSRG